jgi:hypothetical protein
VRCSHGFLPSGNLLQDYPLVTNYLATFQNAYEVSGQLMRTTADNNGTIPERNYDVLGYVMQIRQSGGGAAQKRADYTYRDDDSLNTVTLILSSEMGGCPSRALQIRP